MRAATTISSWGTPYVIRGIRIKFDPMGSFTAHLSKSTRTFFFLHCAPCWNAAAAAVIGTATSMKVQFQVPMQQAFITEAMKSKTIWAELINYPLQ